MRPAAMLSLKMFVKLDALAMRPCWPPSAKAEVLGAFANCFVQDRAPARLRRL